MKKLEDYLHLHLGCEVLWQDGSKEKLSFYWLHKIQGSNWWDIVKPILRPLSDMTEKERVEAKEYIPLIQNDKGYNLHLFTDTIEAANYIKWLLLHHFDIFDLIKAGLAIDATTLK